jgi:hypothetical protein
VPTTEILRCVQSSSYTSCLPCCTMISLCLGMTITYACQHATHNTSISYVHVATALLLPFPSVDERLHRHSHIVRELLPLPPSFLFPAVIAREVGGCKARQGSCS